MAKDKPAQGNPAKKNKGQDIVSKQKAAADKDASKKAAGKTAVLAKKSAKDQKKAAQSGKSTQSNKGGKGSKQAPKKESIFRKIVNYFRNVRLEIKRTTWPTRDEVLRMSLIVVGALLFFGVFIFLIDWAMTELVRLYSLLDPTVAPTDAAVPTDVGTGTDTTATDTTTDTATDTATDSGDTATDATDSADGTDAESTEQ